MGRQIVTKVHPTAYVDLEAQIGNNVEVGAFSIIHKNVILGNDIKIGSYCELGYPAPLGDGSPLIIGNGSIIRSHSIFYESSSFGEGLITGHRVTAREKTIAGVNFQFGSACEIQGDCKIGDYVRFQSNVFVGKYTTIGNFIWILPYVILTNDPTPPSEKLIGCSILDYASICASSLIMPGVIVGEHSLVAAKACVTKDVKPYTVVAGIPAREICNVSKIKLKDGSGRDAYPWNRHFDRGYPSSVKEFWALKIKER